MVITWHVSCGHKYLQNCSASSLALLSDQLYYMVTCGLEMLQKLTQNQVCMYVYMQWLKGYDRTKPYYHLIWSHILYIWLESWH